MREAEGERRMETIDRGLTYEVGSNGGGIDSAGDILIIPCEFIHLLL